MDSVLDQYVDAHANMVVYLTNSIIQVVNNLTFSLLSQAIQWWRVSRADLHAHPQLITMPPEVHACPSPPSLQIGSRDWHVWGHVLGPCDSNGLNLEIHFVV